MQMSDHPNVTIPRCRPGWLPTLPTPRSTTDTNRTNRIVLSDKLLTHTHTRFPPPHTHTCFPLHTHTCFPLHKHTHTHFSPSTHTHTTKPPNNTHNNTPTNKHT